MILYLHIAAEVAAEKLHRKLHTMVDPKHSRITAPIPPDYEDTHRLALTLCEHLGIDSGQVELGSLQIILGPDNRHRVTWTGSATINLDNLSTLILKARDHTPDTGRPHSHPPDAPCNPGLCTGHPDWSHINRPT